MTTYNAKVLTHLHHAGPRNTLEIAEETGIPRQTVSVALSHLDKRGFVRRVGRVRVNPRGGYPVTIWEAVLPVEQLKAPKPKVEKRTIQRQEFRELGDQETVIRNDKRAVRNRLSRDKDQQRDRLAADVEAFLRDGGEVEKVPGYRPAAPAMKVFANERKQS